MRYFSISTFGLLYIGFAIMLGIRLDCWNNSLPGKCYRASKIALPNAKHPFVDQIYLGVTCFYVFCLMSTAKLLCRVYEQRLYQQKSIIVAGTLQFIVHVYTLVALLISNQSLLDNIALEESWGFGQVIAMVMLAATTLEGKLVIAKGSPACSQLCI